MTENSHQSRLALAALSACFAKALGESDPAFRSRFEAAMNTLYDSLEQVSPPQTTTQETLRWTKEILKQLG
jgi:hypothetical protein